MLTLTCLDCGRNFAPDEGLLPGGDCPADDCPSHDTDTPDLPRQPLVEGDWRLVDAAGAVCHTGQVVTDFRCTPAILEGGTAPRSEGSTGRIQTDRGSYFPSVYNLRWVKEAA